MATQPNLVFILTDDHAAHSIGCYGSVVNQTPHLDRIAAGGARLDSCFCTNSICTPSRANILTGAHSHVNGVTTLQCDIDYRVANFPEALRGAGYRTALFGKWHLGHEAASLPRPQDFDAWQVFPGQGAYNDPEMINSAGTVDVAGYATDIVTDLSLDWIDESDDKPFCVMIHHKAPHRPWVAHPKHDDLYPIGSIPEPDTLFDDYESRSEAARTAQMRVSDDMRALDVDAEMPPELAGEENREERTRWHYQRYMNKYLRTVQSVDDNVGRVLDHLEERGLADNTIVVYTSDQGFFLGDHGWYDKRFIYEESLQMPFMIKWPERIAPDTVVDELVTNIDFAATFLEACGVDPADALPDAQGRSFLPVLDGETPDDWPQSMYYRYWEHDSSTHHVWAHYGVRTRTHKLIYFYNDGLGAPGSSDKVFPPEWELYDLVADPAELHNIADDPTAAEVRAELERELQRLQQHYGDAPHPSQQAAH